VHFEAPQKLSTQVATIGTIDSELFVVKISSASSGLKHDALGPRRADSSAPGQLLY
jgi:hypothetical protein